MIDTENMANYAHAFYTNMVVQQHGAEASDVLRDLLAFLRHLYIKVAPETLTGKLTVFKTLDRNAAIQPLDAGSLGHLQTVVGLPVGNVTIRCLESGRFILWTSEELTVAALADIAVVYSYDKEVEFFHAKRSSALVEKIVQDCASNFAVPTYSSLHEALERYRLTNVKHSSCPILNKVWYDSNRLFLVAGPEFHMRDSLTQFLKSRLRGQIEVRPEQVVDASHPVDIKVTWWLTNRLALIEIKWLGQSREVTKLGTKYSASRARDGAKQLAEYLDANTVQAPTQQTRGYLVIIDARRAKLTAKTKVLATSDALKYENEKLVFNPEYHKSRHDFHEPFRMFAEPKVG